MDFTKRTFDILASFLLLAILLIPFIIIGIISAICDGWPVFLRQERYGKSGSVFKIIKFRTMKNGAPTVASNDINEQYITKWGRFLRKTSIDELPQLINVLKGDMSIVGPRPLLLKEDKIHKLRQKNNIYSVRPGITGWAQINGRDNVSAEEKTKLDREYIDKRSLFFDLKIILHTFIPVIKQENVKQ